MITFKLDYVEVLPLPDLTYLLVAGGGGGGGNNGGAGGGGGAGGFIRILQIYHYQ